MASFMEYLDPTKDPDFWKEVEDRTNENTAIDIKKLMLEVRADRIVRTFEAQGKDPVLVLINDWHEEYHTLVAKPLELNVWHNEVSAIAKLIIEKEYSKKEGNPHLCRYSTHFVTNETTGIFMTLLHEVAEKNQIHSGTGDANGNSGRNLIPIAKWLISCDASLVYAATEGEPEERLPVELALKNYDDDMTSLLLNAMSDKCRVRQLFEHDYSRQTSPRFAFIDFINRPGMKKTVVAVLDSLMCPFSTMLPVLEVSGETAASQQSLYRFRILDGDQKGRRPHLDGSMDDIHFNWNQMSCLQALCMSEYKEAAMKHPAVRLLARRKWALYGRFHIRLHLAVYVTFLVVMSFSLIGSCYYETYHTRIGRLILSGEIFSFAMCWAYLGIELDQLLREKRLYFGDVYNYIDIIGIGTLLLALLCRWSGQHQYTISSLAFIFNYFRLFKFLEAFKATGIYLATISLLIKEILPVFASVYAILMMAFSGSLFIASKRGGTSLLYALEDVLLRQIRVFVEGQSFAESYDDIGSLTTFLILIGTMVSSVILTNLLIAQLSEAYAKAMNDAILQYDIAKIRFALKIENGRTKTTCLRVKHYQEKTLASNDELWN